MDTDDDTEAYGTAYTNTDLAVVTLLLCSCSVRREVKMNIRYPLVTITCDHGTKSHVFVELGECPQVNTSYLALSAPREST